MMLYRSEHEAVQRHRRIITTIQETTYAIRALKEELSNDTTGNDQIDTAGDQAFPTRREKREARGERLAS